MIGTGISTKKLILVALLIFAPNLFLSINDRYERQAFRQTIVEDREECLKAVAERPELREVCYQSASQATEAYSAAQESVRNSRLMFFTIIFGLAAGLLVLSSQIAVLKGKLDA